LPAGIYQDQSVLNPAAARKELMLANGEDEVLVDFILAKVRRAFLVILTLELGPEDSCCCMRHFMEHAFTDKQLPVSREFCDKDPAFGLKIWTSLKRQKFRSSQWEFSAPVFTKEDCTPRLEQSQPLPFLPSGNRLITPTSTGRLFYRPSSQNPRRPSREPSS